MKKLIIAVVLMVVSTAAFCQFNFDGTIEGYLFGKQDETVSYFQKKGFELYSCPDCPKEMTFMTGNIKLSSIPGKITESMVCIIKDSDGVVGEITLHYPPKDFPDYRIHQKFFKRKFGNPSHKYKSLNIWDMGNYSYTIGTFEGSTYHQIQLK